MTTPWLRVRFVIIISTALPAAKIRSDVRSGSENSVPLQCRYSCPAMTVQKMKSLIYINIVYINIHIFGIMLHNIIILKSDQFNKIFDILSTYTIFFFFYTNYRIYYFWYHFNYLAVSNSMQFNTSHIWITILFKL